MEWVFIYILTELYTKDNLNKIKKQGTGYTNGWMEDCMRDIGTKESSMDLEYYSMIKSYLNKDTGYGKMERELLCLQKN